MTIKLQHLRSSVLGKLPLPANIDVGQIAVNFNAGDPFLSIKDSAGNVQRLGGATVSGTAPATPTDGQLWVDTSVDPPELKMWDATNTAWISVAPVPPIATDAPDGTADGTVQYARQVVTAGTGGTPTNTKTWAKVEIPPGTIVSPTAPTTPVDNQLWFNSDDGRLYIYYKDADSSQWIDASPDNLPPQATESALGVAEVATQAEVDAGTDDARIVTPLKLKTSPLASKWTRSGTTLSPKTAGDDVFTSGDVKVGNTAASPKIDLNANGSATFAGTGTAACGIVPNGPFGGRFNAFGSAPSTGNGSYDPDRINFTATVAFFVLNNNSVGVRLNAGSTAWTPQASSAALKDEVPYPKAITSSFDLVKNIKLHRYYYKTQDQDWRDSHPVPYWGPYAEELQSLDPDLFIPADEGAGTDPTYNAALLEMHTLSALQEALTRIEALEAEVTALKGGSI